MLYMSSQCTNDGAYNLTVTFRLGMDTDMAQVLVQNRVSLALPVIPALVQNEGISVKKMSPNTMMIVNLLSPDGRYDSTFLSNYATIYIKDELGGCRALPASPIWASATIACGRGSIRQAGRAQPDAPRTWSPQSASKTSRSRPARSVSNPFRGPAISAHDQYAWPPRRTRTVRRYHPQGWRQYQTRTGRRRRSALPASGMQNRAFPGWRDHEGGSNSQGSVMSQATGIVRLRDVARVELGSRQYDQTCTLDGKPSVAVSIYQLPGSNALRPPTASTPR